MIPSSLRVPVPFSYAFPHGALALGVDAAVDFGTPGQKIQTRDKDTGELVWTVTLMDLDPEARRFGRDRIKVKIVAPVAPVLPPSAVPGYPPAVVLGDLVLVPYVDGSKCKGAPECKARIAYSMRAGSITAPSLSNVQAA